MNPYRIEGPATISFSGGRSSACFRADEPERVAKLAGKNGEPYWRVAPMARAGVSRWDVARFWAAQDFDLKLPNHGGVTPHGNCDLCFLKRGAQVFSLIVEKPDRALWWMEQEALHPSNDPRRNLFRLDRPSYRVMYEAAMAQRGLCFGDDFGLGDCSCAD